MQPNTFATVRRTLPLAPARPPFVAGARQGPPAPSGKAEAPVRHAHLGARQRVRARRLVERHAAPRQRLAARRAGAARPRPVLRGGHPPAATGVGAGEGGTVAAAVEGPRCTTDAAGTARVPRLSTGPNAIAVGAERAGDAGPLPDGCAGGADRPAPVAACGVAPS